MQNNYRIDSIISCLTANDPLFCFEIRKMSTRVVVLKDRTSCDYTFLVFTRSGFIILCSTSTFVMHALMVGFMVTRVVL